MYHFHPVVQFLHYLCLLMQTVVVDAAFLLVEASDIGRRHLPVAAAYIVGRPFAVAVRE